MEQQALELMTQCTNAGRWGTGDQLGTLNLITPEKRRAAAGLVRDGYPVSLSRPISTTQSLTNPRPAWHVMQLANHDYAAADSLHLQIHGHATTHLDALGHMFWEGVGYNGMPQKDVVSHSGLTALDVDQMSAGIFTRGLFLDVAGAVGREYLSIDDTVSADLLDAAANAAGDQAEPGDAVIVHTGLEAREAALGPEDPSTRCGLDLSAVAWLREHDVAVYGGDCIEKIPALQGRVELPLHQIGIAAIGLAILDCVSLLDLRTACRDLGRSTFLLTINPLRIPGATGSPVNPIAMF